MGTHLTERVVKAAEIGTRKYVIFDEACAGFGLCVFESGRKTFILIYRAAGRQRRMTIGTWPSWSVIAAREEAKRLKRDIDRGEDPMDTRTNARHAPTVDELIERYIDEHLPKLSASSGKDQASMVRTLVLPEWRSRKVTDITPTDVDRLLTKVAAGRPRVWKKAVKPIKVPRAFKSKQSNPKPPPKTFKPTPVRANRVGEVLRKMFSLAVTWKMRTDNPATSFRKRPETARERFLSFEENRRKRQRSGLSVKKAGQQ